MERFETRSEGIEEFESTQIYLSKAKVKFHQTLASMLIVRRYAQTVVIRDTPALAAEGKRNTRHSR